MATVEECLQTVKAFVRDDSNVLDPIDYDLALIQALSHYSLFRPRRLSQTLTVGANNQIAISSITSFDEGFVHQLKIEYPVLAQGEPQWLYRDDWSFEDMNSGQVLRLYAVAPNEQVRVVHQTPHLLPTLMTDNVTVRASDVQAVCQWAAAECLQMMGNRYSSQASEHNIMGADIASFVSKGADCESRARTLRRMFDDHLKSSISRNNILVRA